VNNKERLKTIIRVTTAILILAILIIFFYRLGRDKTVSTDDAYVSGNMIMITPQEDGIVTTIFVDNTQLVEVGQPLLALDKQDFEIALAKARADLADTVRKVKQMFIHVCELEAKKRAILADAIQAKLDYEHRLAVVSQGGVSQEEFEHSEITFRKTLANLDVVEQELKSARAEVDHTTLEEHPLVAQAKAAFKQRYLSLQRTIVRAPTRGIITQRKAQVGTSVQAGVALMALIPLDQMWVDANYREVDLQYLRLGQSVTLISDMYGSKVKFHGEIVGLNPGTGSVFSILPPQNASGNWIKIVQRLPVKIALQQSELKKHPLFLGLSMSAKTNVEKITEKLQTTKTPLYQTNIYENQLQGVEEMIAQVIQSQ